MVGDEGGARPPRMGPAGSMADAKQSRLRESRVRAFVAGSSAEMKERLMRAFDPAGICRQVLDTRRASCQTVNDTDTSRVQTEREI